MFLYNPVVWAFHVVLCRGVYRWTCPFFQLRRMFASPRLGGGKCNELQQKPSSAKRCVVSPRKTNPLPLGSVKRPSTQPRAICWGGSPKYTVPYRSLLFLACFRYVASLRREVEVDGQLHLPAAWSWESRSKRPFTRGSSVGSHE